MNLFGFLSTPKKQKVERFMVKFLNSIHLNDARYDNRRDEKRNCCAVGIRVTPCVRNNRPEPHLGFDAVTKDINTFGISFVHKRQFGGNERLFISMEFEEQTHYLLCEVRHCSEIGRSLYLTGCAIVDRLEPEEVPELSKNS